MDDPSPRNSLLTVVSVLALFQSDHVFTRGPIKLLRPTWTNTFKRLSASITCSVLCSYRALFLPIRLLMSGRETLKRDSKSKSFKARITGHQSEDPQLHLSNTTFYLSGYCGTFCLSVVKLSLHRSLPDWLW